MSAITVSASNFDNLVLNSSKPVLLDFWANRCPSCRVISPVIDEIATEHSEIVVGKINVEEEQELATKFRVMSIPTLFVLKEGKIVNRSVGAISKSQILNMLN